MPKLRFSKKLLETQGPGYCRACVSSGLTAMDFIAPEDYERVTQEIQSGLKRGVVKNLDYCVVRTDEKLPERMIKVFNHVWKRRKPISKRLARMRGIYRKRILAFAKETARLIQKKQVCAFIIKSIDI